MDLSGRSLHQDLGLHCIRMTGTPGIDFVALLVCPPSGSDSSRKPETSTRKLCLRLAQWVHPSCFNLTEVIPKHDVQMMSYQHPIQVHDFSLIFEACLQWLGVQVLFLCMSMCECYKMDIKHNIYIYIYIHTHLEYVCVCVGGQSGVINEFALECPGMPSFSKA